MVLKAGKLQSQSSKRLSFKGKSMAGKPSMLCKEPAKRNTSCSKELGNSNDPSKGESKPLFVIGT